MLYLNINIRTRLWHSVTHQTGVEYAKKMTCLCAMTSKNLTRDLEVQPECKYF